MCLVCLPLQIYRPPYTSSAGKLYRGTWSWILSSACLETWWYQSFSNVFFYLRVKSIHSSVCAKYLKKRHTLYSLLLVIFSDTCWVQNFYISVCLYNFGSYDLLHNLFVNFAYCTSTVHISMFTQTDPCMTKR